MLSLRRGFLTGHGASSITVRFVLWVVPVRDADRKSSSFPHVTFNLEAAAVRFNRLLHNNQSQPGSSNGPDIGGAVERFKQMFQVRVWDADAVIAYSDRHYFSR